MDLTYSPEGADVHARCAATKTGEKMRRRLRKLIGTSVMLVFVPLYALVAMALAQARPVREASGFIQVLCFTGLGLIWILPMMPLIKWMEKPDSKI
jgi:hypothetical protein